ncbi:hypothetical protein NPIL_381821 [Nephila pilipes]|uniref:Uncharacterized protein n=1 Tax=Nephila pilipes TaxID=299642 RepID=A0A8X6QZS9_NEPPI|nr:hypothetical protein NPIL_381821 [Nephila pilipes]
MSEKEFLSIGGSRPYDKVQSLHRKEEHCLCRGGLHISPNGMGKRYPALVRGLLSSPYGGGCSALSRWAMKSVLYCWKPILMQRVHRKEYPCGGCRDLLSSYKGEASRTPSR